MVCVPSAYTICQASRGALGLAYVSLLVLQQALALYKASIVPQCHTVLGWGTEQSDCISPLVTL